MPALNSFVLLARKVVSALLLRRVIALMENSNADYRLCFWFVKIGHTEASPFLRDASGKRFLLNSYAAFCG